MNELHTLGGYIWTNYIYGPGVFGMEVGLI